MDVQILVETTFDDGSTQRRAIARLDLTPDNLATENLGLRLDEAKNLLTRLQEVLLCNQIDEVLAASRICDDCGKRRAIHDDRGRTLDTLYGRFRVKAPRLRQCACKLGTGAAKVVLLSPLNVLFPDGATLEFQRLQAELGSRHSFREATRLLEMFLPCAPQSNTTVRNRLGRIAEKLDVAAEGHGDKNARATSSPLTVFLDGAHIRCRPEYQKRHLDVVVGKVENANMSRRFGLVQQAARSPAKQL